MDGNWKIITVVEEVEPPELEPLELFEPPVLPELLEPPELPELSELPTLVIVKVSTKASQFPLSVVTINSIVWFPVP